MVGPMVGSGVSSYGYGWSPINQVTPFTYRDNATYLTILNSLCDKLNQMIVDINNGFAQSDANLLQAIEDLTAYINSEIARLEAILEQTDGDPIVFDPTQGQLKKGAGQVISRTYDNARIFAYFAKDYDDKGFTAKAYDDQANSARHYDLGITHPTLNDILD